MYKAILQKTMSVSIHCISISAFVSFNGFPLNRLMRPWTDSTFILLTYPRRYCCFGLFRVGFCTVVTFYVSR